jgi:hypothetical protein
MEGPIFEGMWAGFGVIEKVAKYRAVAVAQLNPSTA